MHGCTYIHIHTTVNKHIEMNRDHVFYEVACIFIIASFTTVYDITNKFEFNKRTFLWLLNVEISTLLRMTI